MTFREIDLAIKGYHERLAKLADIHGGLTEVIVGLWSKKRQRLTRASRGRGEAAARTSKIGPEEAAALLASKGQTKRRKEHREFERQMGKATGELAKAYAEE